MSVKFVVPGEAVSFATMTTKFQRAGRLITGTRKTDKAADWQATVRAEAAKQWGERNLIEGPVGLIVQCWFLLPQSAFRKRNPPPERHKTTRPDLDKILRLILDALETVVYAQDSQVAHIAATKMTAAQGRPAMTRVCVWEISE